METIHDKAEILKAVSGDSRLVHLLSVCSGTTLRSYTRGEIVTYEAKPLGALHFLIDGIAEIYDITDDGNRVPLSLKEPPSLLGDMEFCSKTYVPFYVEAVEPSLFFTVPIAENREILENDVCFLKLLISSLSKKLELTGLFEARSRTIRERLLYYMNNVFEDGVLTDIEGTATELRCSRRHLQRVLREMTDTGELIHTGRGKYKLSGR